MNMLIHPIVVHFPVAVYFLETVLLILYAAKKDEHYFRFARFCFYFAFFAGLAALASGLYDTGGFDGIVKRVKPHFFAAVALTAVQTGRGIYWKFSKSPKLNILIATALIGYALVSLTGYFGGEIVYSS